MKTNEMKTDFELIKEKLLLKLPEKNIDIDHSMAGETTFRCGGNASLFVTVDDIEELSYCISVMKAFGVQWMIIGNGSNMLFTDDGYDGVVIKPDGEFREIVVDGNEIIAGSAALIAYISKIAAASGLSGLEFACGIPGSLGGAVFMNAGAYDGCMKDCLKSVTAMNLDGEIYEYDADELELAYRHSRFMDSGEIILSAKLILRPEDREVIQEKMNELNAKRKSKQPLNYPSAGSFFKRPEGYFAAALIEQAGLKGTSVGGAQVSELHSGFIINKGDATAADVLNLCRLVQEKVKTDKGVELEPEVRIIGKWSF